MNENRDCKNLNIIQNILNVTSDKVTK